MITSLEQFYRTYDVEDAPVKINGRALRFLKPRHIDRFIDPDNVLDGFPLWAKIWDAAAILAGFMADLPVVPGRRILELGAGIGMAGITAAAFGHQITLTEHDPHALAFIRANAWLNGCAHVAVEHLDWTQPTLPGRFDLIIGSEIVYNTGHIDPLLALFERYLPGSGRVVLVEGLRATGVAFFEKMAQRFEIRTRKHSVRSAHETQMVVLFDMQPRPVSATP